MTSKTSAPSQALEQNDSTTAPFFRGKSLTPKQAFLYCGLFSCAIAILATLAAIRYSMRHGRLSMPLAFDDIDYIYRGFVNLEALRTLGLHAFLANLWIEHAPGQTLLATIGFSAFGIRPWAPYAINGVLLLFVLIALLSIVRDLPVLIRTCFVLAIAAAPLFVNLLAEFRPDLFWGLLCGFACYQLLNEASLAPRARNQLLVVLLCAVAIIWKPSAFAPSFALLGFTSCLGLTAAIWERNPATTWQSIVRRYLWSTVGLFLLLTPFFWVNAKNLLDYMQLFVNPAQIAPYRTGNTWLQDANVFLFGINYRSGLFYWLPVGSCIIALNLILDPPCRQFSRLRYRMFVAITACAYIIPVLSPVKSFFLGGQFYGCFIFLTVVGGCRLILWCYHRAPRLKPIAFGMFVVIFLCELHRPQLSTTMPSQIARELNAITDTISAALINDIRAHPNAPQTLFVESPDPISDSYLIYAASLKGISINKGFSRLNRSSENQGLPQYMGTGYYIDSLDEAKREAEQCRYIFLSQHRLGMNYPGDRLTTPMIAWALSNPHYKVVADYVDDSGKDNYLLRRE